MMRLRKTEQFAIKTKGTLSIDNTRLSRKDQQVSLAKMGYSLLASSKDGQSCPNKRIILLCRGVEEQKVFQWPQLSANHRYLKRS
jgi:hypothetical protein